MISKEEVQKVAKLARLELTDTEIKKMQTDLSAILDYFKILQNANLKPQNENKKLEMNSNATRKDEVIENKDALVKGDHIKVKQVL